MTKAGDTGDWTLPPPSVTHFCPSQPHPQQSPSTQFVPKDVLEGSVSREAQQDIPADQGSPPPTQCMHRL